MADNSNLIIYGRKNSINVMKVIWCCAELGVTYERIDLGGSFGFDNVPNYASLNPNQRVPTLQDGEMILWESNVIVRYLSSNYGDGLLMPKTSALRWEAEKWMDWMQTTLNPHLSVLLVQTVRTPPEQRDNQAVETARKALSGLWGIMDSHLADRQFVAGDALSMGDIPLGVAVYRWYAFDVERPAYSNLEAWRKRLLERQPYQEHVNQPLT